MQLKEFQNPRELFPLEVEHTDQIRASPLENG